MPQLGQHPLEPQHVARGFHPYHHLSLELAVEWLGLGRRQLLLRLLSCFCINHDDLLETRMEITAYNLHWRLLSFRVLVFVELKSTRSFVRSRHCYESKPRKRARA